MKENAGIQIGQSMTVPLNVVGGTSFARYPKITNEATYNMIVTGADIGAPALADFLGYKKVVTSLQGEARELFFSTRDNAMYAVLGNRVIRVTKALTSSIVGALDTSTGSVFISENQNSQIGIVDGQKLYVYNYSDFTFQIPVIDFRPLFIDYQDTYLIATGDDANWHLSDSNDALTWDPLRRNSMQTQADTIQAAVRLNRQLWVIGEKVTELWHNQGRPLFPYARDNSLAIGYGCVSRDTIDEAFGILVWLAKNDNSNASIVVTTGGPPQEISTDGLDFKLGNLNNPDKSFGFLFQEDGHVYYQLTFYDPDDNFSLLYDFSAKLFYNVTDECLNHHIAKKVKLFGNKLLFISDKDSNIYQMDSQITTYDGHEIPRIRICPPIRFPSDDRFIVDNVKLQLEQGINEDAGRVDLSVSRDGGYNYGNILTKSMNTLANRRGQFRYWRLGSANDFTVQLRFWGNGRFVVTNGTVDIRR